MTLHDAGYVLEPGASIEDLDMGGGSIFSLRVTGDETHGLVSVIEGSALEGGPPLHVLDAEDQVVVVLEGELTYALGPQHGVLGAGGLLWIPRAVPHAVANYSGGPCRFLMISMPAGIEAFFRAQRDYLRSLSSGTVPDPAALGALPEARTRRVVGPPIEPIRPSEPRR